MSNAGDRCIVVAFISPREGAFDQVKAILESVIPGVHEEPGCEFYALHEDTTGRLVFIEAWDSRELWINHTGLSAVATINERTTGLLATEPDVIEMYGLPVGGEKGVVPPVRSMEV